MTVPTRRPWWAKKRWAAAGLLWLVVAYLCGFFPAAYAVQRGWVPLRVMAPYRPVFAAAGHPAFKEAAPRAYDAFWRLLLRVQNLGAGHRFPNAGD